MDKVLSELKMNDRNEFCLYKFSGRKIGKTGEGHRRREVEDHNEITVVTDRRGHEEP